MLVAAPAVVLALLPLLAGAQDGEVSYSVSLSTGTLIGIIAGCVVALVLLICCCCCMRKRRKTKRQRELQAAVAAALVNTPKGDDSHAIDVPYEQQRQHNTGSTYTGSTTHPHRSGNAYGGGYQSSTGQSHGSGGRHSSSLWDDPVIVAARIPVDRVELGELLSRGGFGEVYRGRYREQTVAVKTLLPSTRKDMNHIEAFLAEIKLMATMEHAQIVQFVGVAWESLSELYAVSEFMEGGDLRTLLVKYYENGHPRGFDPAKIKMALQVAHALTYLPKQYRKHPSGALGIREGISAGDAAVREVIAYLLDHQHFARVPVTMLASIYHPDFHFQASETPHRKTGALQAYVAHRDTADDVGSGLFNVAEVHAVAILDIRLANQDRHGGNLLVVGPTQTVSQTSNVVVTKFVAGKKVSLVPIDHGACLPRISALSETSFMWLLWSQSKQPFSRAAREYIAALDADLDLKLLEDNLPANYQLEREAILTLHACTALLKFCVLDRHMNAYDIGMLMCRQGTADQQELGLSVLEKVVASSLRDPLVIKNEAVLKLQDKQPVQRKSLSQDKSWSNYVTSFLTAFRRELVAQLAATN